MNSDLISVVNRLQNTFSSIGGDTVDLPQIVVVGSQSSGKSSVLENIVGKDFLPRGSGIVTRRPLVLQLVNEPSGEEYGQFLHNSRKIYDFDAVRDEIESETTRVAGSNKGISRMPIHLRIVSPNVVNLTLVDLPGLTKIPVGDQPSDIERQIRTLVQEFVEKPNALILAVSPANVDLANSESLKLARSVDPAGARTIGVLTKMDLMEPGTNAVEILTGKMYPLKLGFVGVVNRSQQDITSRKSMSSQLDSEREFFVSHPAYRAISDKCGTSYLAKMLNRVLLAHIQERLPEMKARLNTLMGQTQQELAALGGIATVPESERGSYILRLMTQFSQDFVASVDGTSQDSSVRELCGGARIYYIFNDVFSGALASIDPSTNLTDNEVRTAIRNATGPRPTLFVPEQAFELLVKPQIRLLQPPAIRCVEMVYEELMKICHSCSSAELKKYPYLHALLVEVISDLLRERLSPTSAFVSSLIEIETAYINTNHPQFIETLSNGGGTSQSLLAAPQYATDDVVPPEPSEYDGASSDGSPDSSGHLHTEEGNPKSGYSSTTSTGTVANHTKQASASSTGGAKGQHARDKFYTLFFGNDNSTTEQHPENASAAAIAAAASSAAKNMSATQAQFRASSSGNLLAGRPGLEGNAAAFSMRSLDAHLPAPQPAAPKSTPTSYNVLAREQTNTSLIRSLIDAYFSIVRQQVQDLVPKSIMLHLVNYTRESIHNTLVRKLYREDLFDKLLHEDAALVQERHRIQNLLAAYREAFRTLSETF